MDPLIGVDISRYQGADGIAEATLRRLRREAEAVFVINRASIRLAFDPSFGPNRALATSLGMDFGAYHFLAHGSVRRQAETFYDSVMTNGGWKGVGAFLDVESYTVGGRVVPSLCPRWLDVVSFVRRFRELAPGHPIWCYTSEGYWTGGYVHNADGDALFDGLWQARWIDGDPVSDITLPPRPPRAGFGGWGTTPLWQWGAIRMQRGTIDGDAFYGTRDEFRAIAGRVRPPIPDRPNYALGYSAALTEIAAAVPAVIVPAGPPGPAYPAGVDAARADVLAAVERLRVKG